MKRFKLDDIQPADILFTARPLASSKVIRLATDGIVSHAMICVQHSSFIDSTMEGVLAKNLQRELFRDDEKLYHFRLREPITQTKLLSILDYARSQIGTRYSLVEAARSVGSIRKPRLKRQFCSRLVARAYRHAGLDLVSDADYCSPEDLRKSSLLVELPVATESVSEEEALWWTISPNAVEQTHIAYKKMFAAIRIEDPNVENLDDLMELRLIRPELDTVVVDAMRSSGYLDLWRVEQEQHPWRYDHDLMSEVPPSEPALNYCLSTVREAYSGGTRFAVNLATIESRHAQHPRNSFVLEIDLYRTLGLAHQSRREVAISWLRKHFPTSLAENMEQIEPHSERWFYIVDRVEPKLSALARQAIRSEASPKVCSSCGDQPPTAYRIVNDAEVCPGVPSLYLCDDCVQIRRKLGNKLEAFFSLPSADS